MWTQSAQHFFSLSTKFTGPQMFGCLTYRHTATNNEQKLKYKKQIRKLTNSGGPRCSGRLPEAMFNR